MTCVLLNTQMDSKEIRRKNLAKLREQFETVQRMADFTEIQRPQLTDYINGKRSVGDNIARRLEHVFNKPRGWMDVTHDLEEEKEQVSKEILDLAILLSNQPPENIEKAQQILAISGITAEIPANVIHIPDDALILTDPIEKNLITTFRSAGKDVREMFVNLIRISRNHKNHNNDQDSEKSRNQG